MLNISKKISSEHDMVIGYNLIEDKRQSVSILINITSDCSFLFIKVIDSWLIKSDQWYIKRQVNKLTLC